MLHGRKKEKGPQWGEEQYWEKRTKMETFWGLVFHENTSSYSKFRSKWAKLFWAPLFYYSIAAMSMLNFQFINSQKCCQPSCSLKWRQCPTLDWLWYQDTDWGGDKVSITQVRLTIPLMVSRNISGPPRSRVIGSAIFFYFYFEVSRKLFELILLAL